MGESENIYECKKNGWIELYSYYCTHKRTWEAGKLDRYLWNTDIRFLLTWLTTQFQPLIESVNEVYLILACFMNDDDLKTLRNTKEKFVSVANNYIINQ